MLLWKFDLKVTVKSLFRAQLLRERGTRTESRWVQLLTFRWLRLQVM